MNELTIVPAHDKLQERSDNILEWCQAIEITDDEEYQIADSKVVECKNMMKMVKFHHDPVCDATNKAHKAATGLRKKLFDPPDQASKILSIKMGNYKQQRDAEISEEQRLLDEKAKKDHQAACEKEAQEADANGNKEVAVALREMKDDAPITQQVTQMTLMSTTKFRKDWEITNEPRVADVPQEYLVVDKAAIMRVIRAKKGVIQIPGVEFKEIDVPIRRGE